MGKGKVSWRATRLESLARLPLLISIYAQQDGTWLLFAVLFLAPDLSALGYFVNSRIGALGYNLGHTPLGPIMLAALGLSTATTFPVTLAVIWAAHITFDRAIGYGLKDIDVPVKDDPNTLTRLPGSTCMGTGLLAVHCQQAG